MIGLNLSEHKKLLVRQRFEIAEWVGFETRNKYEVTDEQGRLVAFAAEQQKGIFGFLLRQVLGHWRSFEIHFYSPDRHQVMVVTHPFRFFFKRLEVADSQGRPLGAIQQRFAFLGKRFDLQSANGQVILEVSSPIWRIWTFKFERNGVTMASVQKKWAGLFAEGLTDKDNFLVDFTKNELNETERKLILSAALFIDLQYFERKAD